MCAIAEKKLLHKYIDPIVKVVEENPKTTFPLGGIKFNWGISKQEKGNQIETEWVFIDRERGLNFQLFHSLSQVFENFSEIP